MHSQREIKFKATPAISKLNAEKVVYQGQIIHNQTLNPRETREAFADYTRLTLPMGNLAIDSISAFIAKEIAAGHHLDFGDFAVGLKMRGGLPAANSPFDPAVNSLSIEITPSAALKKAVRHLKPVNVTGATRSYVWRTIQREPIELRDAFNASGTRILRAYGCYIAINPSATGEGVWIENDAGEQVLEGRILPGCDISTCNFELTGDIAPGLYWIALQSRTTPEGPLLRCQRRIKAV